MAPAGALKIRIVSCWMCASILLGLAPLRADPIVVVREKNGHLFFTNRSAPAGAQPFRPGFLGRYPRSQGRADPLNMQAFRNLTSRAARRYRLDHALIRAVIHAESAFNPRAVSPKGAGGLMQLMPQTARELGVRDRFSAADNIAGGARYLAQLLKRFGRLEYALAAYNAGPRAVEQYRGVPPYAETRNYVRRVMVLRSRYGG